MMISDVRMPGISGLETLRRARKEHSLLPVLLVTAYADIREAVGAMRDGALNYLAKPIDLDELLASVRQATGLSEEEPLLFSEHRQLPAGVVARSPLMQAVFRDASLIAPSESRVLITGESGVGKEVLADVIHAWSPRSAGPLVRELRRHPRYLAGERTLRTRTRRVHGRGRPTDWALEMANGGTIFLDEIGEMSPQLQANCSASHRMAAFNASVRTWKSRPTPASGGQQSQPGRGGQAGRFREDLFYRLNVVELNLPPLRERREIFWPWRINLSAS